MKLLSNLLLSMVLAFVATTAFAAGSQTNVLVIGIQVGQAIPGGYGPFLMHFAANAVSSASCVASGSLKYFAIDPTTDQGRTAIAAAIAAYETGKTVSAEGAGTCNIYSGVEDLSYFVTTD